MNGSYSATSLFNDVFDVGDVYACLFFISKIPRVGKGWLYHSKTSLLTIFAKKVYIILEKKIIEKQKQIYLKYSEVFFEKNVKSDVSIITTLRLVEESSETEVKSR